MSRALNIDATHDDVMATCDKNGMAISTIERLHPVGVRIVLLNANDAAVIARAYKNKLLTGPVTRTPLKVR